MAFINARLLEGVAYGTAYGTGFRTNIKTLRSGRERRNAEWSVPRGSFAIVYKSLREGDHAKVLQAFQACHGRLHSFRLQDLTDYKVEGAAIGVGTGTPQVLPLVRQFGFGDASIEVPVPLPVAGTVQVFADGAPASVFVDYEAATVAVTAADGALITWSGEFDKIVRFDDDDLQFSFDNRAGGIKPLLSTDVALQEVFE